MDAHPRTHSYALDPLSQREQDVLALLALDLSDREIADRLVLAYTTVKWYNRQIFSKLGVENRQQAVERAFDLGILQRRERTTLHHMPAQLTPLVGRSSELEALGDLFNHANTRLVTILAQGGIGKTRLALAFAESAAGRFADDVYFVALAPLTSSAALMTTIADTVGLQLFPDRRTLEQQVIEFLCDQRALLVLDNFEHLLEGAGMIADLLSAAPQVKVLVTSRERLNLEGETVYTLGGLHYPPQAEGENLLEYDAAQLFVACAQRANSRFTAQDQANIVRICQLVQGMPLAIELAAAWSGTLSPVEIADEITRSADFLHTAMRNFPERLRSIRAVFGSTWKRLNDDERQRFRRLSVFHGGCTREAAQVIAGADLDTLAELVDKALLWHQVDSGRYEIHELLRQYAAEQLDAAGEREAVEIAHRDYYGQLAQVWSRQLRADKQLQALDSIEADFDNVRAAFWRAIDSRTAEALEPFADLWYFYEIRTRNIEGMTIYRTAVEALTGQDSIALAKLLAGLGVFYERFWDFEQERRFASESLAMLRRLRAESEMAFPLVALGVAELNLGAREEALNYWNEGLELARRYHNQWVEYMLIYCIGIHALLHNELEDARQHFLESYALVVKLESHWGAGFVLRDLAYFAYREGDYEEARRLFEAGIASARKIHHVNNVSAGLNGLYRVARATGDLAQARRYAEEDLRVNRDIGDRHGVFWATVSLADVSIHAGAYEEAREHLREALRMSGDLEVRHLLDFAFVLAQFLAQTNAKALAAALAAFLDSYPEWNFPPAQYERERLQALTSKLQSELPENSFEEAVKAGQTLRLDDLLTQVRAVI